MAEDEKKNEEIKDQEPGFINKDDEQLEKLERILAGIRPGWKVAIHRESPSWCRSYLETVELGDTDQLDLDYLADNWGGDVLRLRFMDSTGTYKASVAVPMRSYPPKVRGRRITRNFDSDEDALPKRGKFADNPQTQIIQTPAPQNNIETILGLLKQTRSEDLKTFKMLLDNTPTDAPQAVNGVSNLIELATQLKELKGLFGDAEASLNAPPGDDQAALFQTIGEVAKAVLGNKEAPPQPPRLVQQTPQNQVANVNPRPNPQRVSMAAALASMPTDQAADVCFSALTRMPPEKKEQAINEILTRLNNDPELDYEDEGDLDGDEHTTDSELPTDAASGQD